jgi:hypothetical protein
MRIAAEAGNVVLDPGECESLDLDTVISYTFFAVLLLKASKSPPARNP